MDGFVGLKGLKGVVSFYIVTRPLAYVAILGSLVLRFTIHPMCLRMPVFLCAQRTQKFARHPLAPGLGEGGREPKIQVKSFVLCHTLYGDYEFELR